MAIKVHLSRLMGERKLKISDLAKMTGLHRNGLTELYNEKTNGIKFETLEKICRALECDICDLLEIVDDNNDKNNKNKSDS
jgi:putative transcriptional regulator